MKLLRVGDVGEERPAVLLPDGRVLDVSSVVRDYDGTSSNAGAWRGSRDPSVGGPQRST